MDFKLAVESAVVLGLGMEKGTDTENWPPNGCEAELVNQRPAAAETGTVYELGFPLPVGVKVYVNVCSE
jgi:hypothetical protein